MKKLKELWNLFFIMFKIGLFTFGGGYAMVAIIERELVDKRKWIEHDEFLDVMAISESTPGPLAINSATFIGYKVSGVLGSVAATLGVVLPAFIVIFIISLFFDRFLELEYVAYAFKGIQACVVFLIGSAGIKMLKHIKFNFLNIFFMIATAGCMIGFALFSVNFSSIFYILIGGGIGVFIYLISLCKKKITTKKASLKNTDNIKTPELTEKETEINSESKENDKDA